MIGILDRIVASALRSQAERGRGGRGGRRRHAALAEAAKQLLTLRATDPLDLTELSGTLGCSPFHLCHVSGDRPDSRSRSFSIRSVCAAPSAGSRIPAPA
jgi:hypothetical protein